MCGNINIENKSGKAVNIYFGGIVMKKSEEKRSVLSLILIIASAIVVAAGAIMAFKYFCDKYKITERKSKKFIDFSDEDEWSIDDCDLGLDEFEEIDEVPTEDEEVSE